MKKILLVPLLAVLVLTGCSADKKSTETPNGEMKTIKIGAIMPLSGDAGSYGEQGQRVMDYQIEKINEKYKKDNIQFQLVYEDGKCMGNDAVNAYQKLTEIDGVKFLMGGFCSSETLAIAPLTKDGSAFVAAVASSPVVNKASDYVFSFSFSDDLTGQKLADEMSKYKKVAIISEQNDYNIAIEDVWKQTLKAKYPDVQIVASEKYPKSGSDFRNVLEKVKKAQPDAILLNPNAGAPSQNLLKQLAEMKDWKGYHLFGAIAYMTESTLKLAPETVEGMTIVDTPLITNPEFTAVRAEIEKQKGTVADIGNYYTAALMDDLNVMTSLIVEFNGDPKAARNAFVTRDFKGYISDSFNFRDSSFPSVSPAVYVIKNTKPELVK